MNSHETKFVCAMFAIIGSVIIGLFIYRGHMAVIYNTLPAIQVGTNSGLRAP
jgi:hypothetical protein